MENTEYVATSALKNFHPAIFGPVSITNNPDDVLPATYVPMPGLSFSLENSMTGPAIKMTSDLWESNLRKFGDKFFLFNTLYKHFCKGGEEESIVDLTTFTRLLEIMEINKIQRECYRCLKTYHRVYLSTEAKGLISFHLKHIFLRTIEETGGEMWIESRRAECMSKLFANLLKALRERHLPHYFVQSYNLFDIDYIEDPAILESLTERVEQIMENPMKFAEELILVTQGKHSSPVQEQEQMNGPYNQLQSELMLLSGLMKEKTERVRRETTRKVCQDTINDLIEAMNNADCILENLDPMERTVVEDLREMQKEHSSIANFYLRLPLFITLFSTSGNILDLNDINLRHFFLAFLKQVTETYKYVMPLLEAGKGPEDVLRHMLNPVSENRFDWNLDHLPGLDLEEDEKETILLVKHSLETLLGDANSNEDDIPLD